jgi:hypothetical protein
MASLTKVAGTALGTAGLAAIAASAGAVPETEPNNTFPGQNATVGTTFTGGVCRLPGCSPADEIDFYHYTGLPEGTFILTLDPAAFLNPPEALRAGLYTDQDTIIDFVDSTGAPVDLTGDIPLSGELVFGVTVIGESPGFEGYSLVLNVTSAQVAEPATLVLLGAGLMAAGVGVVRRRKRS